MSRLFALAQVSDVHVSRHAPDSGRRLQRLLASLQAHRDRIDAVLWTGDLLDRSDGGSYGALRAALDGLALPCFVLNGNHDRRHALRHAFAHHAYLPRRGKLHWCVADFPVAVIALDSVRENCSAGVLQTADYQFLQTSLQRLPAGQPAILALHHPPFAIGFAVQDAVRLQAAEKLAAMLAGRSQVRLLLCGHVHIHVTQQWAGRLAVSAPPALYAADFGQDGTTVTRTSGWGGWLLHSFYADGAIQTSHIALFDI